MAGNVQGARIWINMAGDVWNGTPQFNISIDGQDIGDSFGSITPFWTGNFEAFSFDTRLATGIVHNITFTYFGDETGGTADQDKNLYIEGVSINGDFIPGSAQSLLANGSFSCDFLFNENNKYLYLPAQRVLPYVNRLTINVSEDAWNGDAQFTVSIDGKTSGLVYTAYAANATGQSYEYTTNELLTSGNHNIQINYLNPASGGTDATTRRLYVLGAVIDSKPIINSAFAISNQVEASFQVTVPETSATATLDAFLSSMYHDVTNKYIDAQILQVANESLRAGASLSDVRTGFSHSSDAAEAIALNYRTIFGRSATTAEIANQEDALARGSQIAGIRFELAHSSESFSQLVDAGIRINTVNSIQEQLAHGRTQAQVRGIFARGDELKAIVDQAYTESVNRVATVNELTFWQGLVASGVTIGELRATIYSYSGVSSVGNAPDFHDQPNIELKQNLLYDPSIDRLTGYANAFANLTLTGADDQVIASGDARSLLALLPVYVTIYGGQSPDLVLANGAKIHFNDTQPRGNPANGGSNAEELAGYLYRTAQHADRFDPLLDTAYRQTQDYLNQIAQPTLQAAMKYAKLASDSAAAGDSKEALYARTATALLLQLAAEDPVERLTKPTLTSTLNINGHETQVTAALNGEVDFHDVDPGIEGLVEALVTIVVDVLAIIQPQVGLPLATALHLAEAGKAFADGNIIGGVLNLSAAAGTGFASVGNKLASEIVLTASRAVGGTYGIIKGAETGDVAGIVGGLLVSASAIATGLDSAQIVAGVAPAATAYNSLVSTLAAAGALTSFGAALSQGDVEGALLNSLGPWLASVAAESLSNGTLRADQLAGTPTNLVQMSDVPKINVTGEAVAFVGGLTDRTIGGETLMYGAYKQFREDVGGANTDYFSFDQKDQLRNWIQAQTKPVVVIGHSWGADTAYSVVGSGVKVDKVIGLDPVGQVRPDFNAIAANANQFIDLNAVGGGNSIPNLVAAIGGPYGTAARGSATSFMNVNTDHGGIGDFRFVYSLLQH